MATRPALSDRSIRSVQEVVESVKLKIEGRVNVKQSEAAEMFNANGTKTSRLDG